MMATKAVALRVFPTAGNEVLVEIMRPGTDEPVDIGVGEDTVAAKAGQCASCRRFIKIGENVLAHRFLRFCKGCTKAAIAS